MIITAKPNASQRTKNRIREHRLNSKDNNFKITERKDNHPLFNGGAAIFVTHKNNHDNWDEGWWGWLPSNEIIIEEVNE